MQWLKSHQRPSFFCISTLASLGYQQLLFHSGLFNTPVSFIQVLPNGWLVQRKQFSHVYFGRQFRSTYRIFKMCISFDLAIPHLRNHLTETCKWTKAGMKMFITKLLTVNSLKFHQQGVIT